MLQVRPGLITVRQSRRIGGAQWHTSQAVNGPLFKLLERDVRRGWLGVEIQAMRILCLLVGRVCELFLAVVDGISPLGVYTIVVLSQHLQDRFPVFLETFTFEEEFGVVRVMCSSVKFVRGGMGDAFGRVKAT
jgi:hypothetical protein